MKSPAYGATCPRRTIHLSVAPIDFGYHWRNVAIGLVIATLKASCVALIFMHLNHERWWVYGTLILTVVFFLALLLLPVLTSLDGLGTGSPWLPRASGGG